MRQIVPLVELLLRRAEVQRHRRCARRSLLVPRRLRQAVAATRLHEPHLGRRAPTGATLKFRIYRARATARRRSAPWLHRVQRKTIRYNAVLAGVERVSIYRYTRTRVKTG